MEYSCINILNVGVKTNSSLSDPCKTVFKLIDVVGSQIEYYINDELFGDASSGDVFTIETNIKTEDFLILLNNMCKVPGIGEHDKNLICNFKIPSISSSGYIACYINNNFVGDLCDNDNLLIQTKGSSEEQTIKQCFHFAYAELKHQLIANTFRELSIRHNIFNIDDDKYIDSETYIYEMRKLIEPYRKIKHEVLNLKLDNELMECY